jgi:putative transposase
MPRPPRLEYPGAFYHVYSRGNRREQIFWGKEDYKVFEAILLEAGRWSGVRLYAWCLMPNHFHLLVETPEGNLSQFMRRLLTRYARNFNKTHRLVGHVFQGRYRTVVCDKETYLLELVRYIHLNPIKVLKGSLAQRPEDWPWSSHRFYVKGESPEGMKGTMEEVLNRFGTSQSMARRRYEEFVKEGLEKTRWKDFYQVRAKRFLGDEKFLEEAKGRNGESTRQRPRELARIKGLAEFMERASTAFKVEQKALQSESQERSLSRIRKALVYVGRRHYRFRANEIARALRRDITAISQMERRLGGEAEAMAEVQRLLAVLQGGHN